MYLKYIKILWPCFWCSQFLNISKTLPWLDRAHCLLRLWGLLEAYQFTTHSGPKGGTQDSPSPKTRSSCGSYGTWNPRHSRKVMGRDHSPSLVNLACWRRVGQGCRTALGHPTPLAHLDTPATRLVRHDSPATQLVFTHDTSWDNILASELMWENRGKEWRNLVPLMSSAWGCIIIPDLWIRSPTDLAHLCCFYLIPNFTVTCWLYLQSFFPLIGPAGVAIVE